MYYRTLGATGISVSEIGFGAWGIGGLSMLGDMVAGWSGADDAASVDALEEAYDHGITFFDTADVYGDGHSEELIGRVFAGRRDKIVLASKGGNKVVDGVWLKDFSPAYLTRAIEDSLRRLGTDYLDVYLLHTPRTDEQLKACFDALAALEKLRETGKIRAHGISVADEDQGVAMIRAGVGQVVQVVHNILTPGPERELFPLAEERGIGIVARVPLASGFLTGKFTPDTRFDTDDHRSRSYPPEKIRETVALVERLRFLEGGGKRTMAQAALRYNLAMDAVSTVIPGAKNPRQARENAMTSGIEPLTDPELARIREITGGSALS